MSEVNRTLESNHRAYYEDRYVQALFDRMGRTYGVMNVVSSFGFSELWRRHCVRNAGVCVVFVWFVGF